MKQKIFVFLFFTISIWIPLQCWSSVQPLSLSTDIKVNAPRWMFEPNTPVDKSIVVRQLFETKKAEVSGNYQRCFKLAKKLLSQAKGLRPWLSKTILFCTRKIAYKNKKKLLDLIQNVKMVDQNEEWLLSGSHLGQLRQEYLESHLVIIKHQIRLNRNKAWEYINKLQTFTKWMSGNQKAEMYNLAGELAFIQQNFSAAHSMIQRSLEYKDSSALRRKLESIQTNLLKIKGQKKQKIKLSQEKGLEASEQELKLFNQLRAAYRVGDLVSLVGDGIKLMGQYSGSTRAEWAEDRIINAYLKVLGRPSKKYDLLRDKLLKLIKGASSKSLYSWADKLYSRGHYADAMILSRASFEKVSDGDQSTAILLLLAKSSLQSGQYELAEKYFRKLYIEHSGTEAAKEALFRLGLLKFRLTDYSESSSYFERFLAIDVESNYEMHTRYWLWRSQQKLGSERAKEEAEKLMQKYPLTYYGLRAKAELNSGVISWLAKGKKPLQVEFWLTDNERQSWERAQLLIRAGWLEEAQAEVKIFPIPQTPEQKIILAKLWSLAFNYNIAFTLLKEARDEDSSLVNMSLIKLGYPLEFNSYVLKSTKKFKIDEMLVRSIIKQESSLQVKAKSVSNALGLMQLIPSTAKEVARYLRKKNFRTKDLYNPATNIQFGTYYLSRLLRAYNGHVPMALAAYNVGIGNMRKWKNARPVLNEITSKLNSHFENEIWIDELPWSETSYYIKAVLRNYLLYNVVKSDEVKIQDPIWRIN